MASNVVFDIVARDRASATFDKVGRSADMSSGKLKGFQQVGRAAGRALAAGALVGGAALVKMGQAAADDEKAQKALALTLRNTAGATDAQIAATEEWIAAQGKALGVADDDLRPALQRLAEGSKDVGEAQRLATIAMDVSAGTGKSLKTVTEALLRAQNGQVAGLSRYGIATKDAQGKTMSFEQVVAGMAKTFKGQASEAAETTAGKQRKLAVAMGELGEKIGAAVLPAMGALVDIGIKTIAWVEENTTLVGVMVGVFGGLLAIVWAVSAATKAWAAIQAVVAVATKVWAAAQWALNKALLANPIGLAIVAIAALVAGIVIAYKKSETFRNIVDGAFRKVGEAAQWVKDKTLSMVDFFAKMPDKISRATAGMWDGIKDAFRSAVNWIIDGWNGLEFSLPGVKVPGPLPDIPGFSIGTPNIPRLAKGGITTGPTLAVVGDNPGGREAIIPLDRAGGMLGMGGRDVTVTLPVYLDSQKIWEGQVRLYRTSGGQMGVAVA